jgi:hypothetical protein
MTDRNMTGTLVTETQRKSVVYYELVSIEVDTGYYLTNAPFDINYGGNNYIAAGALLGIDAVEENIGFEIGQLNVVVGGIDPLPGDSEPFIKRMLELDYVDRSLIISRQYYQGGADIGAVQLYNGYINAASIERSLGEQGVAIKIETSNNWTDFNRLNGRETNDNSQQAVFPGDLGMQKQVQWKVPS